MNNPRNIPTHAMAELEPEDVRVGHVTIYGIVIGKRPTDLGFYLDFPHDTVIFAESGQKVAVLCAMTEQFAESVRQAMEEHEQAHGGSRPLE